MIIKCRICNKEYKVKLNSQGKLPNCFPFCSKRCQMVDLGSWLEEGYCIEQSDENQNNLKIVRDDQDNIE